MVMTSLVDRASSTEPAGNLWWAVSVDTAGVKETVEIEMEWRISPLKPGYIPGQGLTLTQGIYTDVLGFSQRMPKQINKYNLKIPVGKCKWGY